MFVIDDALILAFEAAAAEAATAAAAEAAATAAATEAATAAAAEAATTAASEAAAANAAQTGASTYGATYGTLSPAQADYLAASQASAGPGIAPGVQSAGSSPNIDFKAVDSIANNAANSAPSATTGFTGAGFKSPPATTNALYSLTGPSAAPGGITSLPTTTPPSAMGQWWNSLSPFEKGMAAFTGTTALSKLGMFGGGGGSYSPQPYSGPLSNYGLSPDFQGRVTDPTQFQYTPRRYAEGGIASVPSYAKGGNLSDAMQYYKMMTAQTDNISENRRAPSAGIDTGIYYDTDPDTQRLDALTAAQIRQAKINKRMGIQGQGMARPQAMGQVNLAAMGTKPRREEQYQDMSAAQGGIMQAYVGGGPVEDMSMSNVYDMQNARGGVSDMGIDNSTGMQRMAGGGISSLGGYAAGGNPRLLKGPGDGMSDNIPAMIGNRQPARLADGEFVIPADVVSHLGNGSTDAGAKKLHQMMNNVRKARTGNSKQGKQINPNKYMPK